MRAWLAVAGASLLAGLGVVVSPRSTLLGLVLVAGAAAVALVPRREVVLLVLFVLLQDPLLVAIGVETPAGKLVKYGDEALVLLVAAGCLARSSVRRALADRGLLLGLAAAYAGMLVSTFPLRVSPVAVGVDLLLFSKPFLILAIGASLAVPEDRIDRVVAPSACVLATVLAVGVVMRLFPGLEAHWLAPVKETEHRMGMAVVRGFFIDSGTYAWLAVATGAVGYAAWLAWGRRAYLVLAGFSSLMLVLTWRRKSILAAAVIVAASLLLRRVRGGRRAGWAAAVVAVLALTVLAPYLQALTDRTVQEYGRDDPYATARGALYSASVRIAADHFPLGTGLGSFGSHASRMEYSDVYREYGVARVWGLSPWADSFVTDTFWPMVLGQGGVVSLAGYLGVLAILGLAALRAIRDDAGPTERFLGMVSLFLLLGSFVESAASHIYGSSLQAMLIFVPAGILWRWRADRAGAASGGAGRSAEPAR